MERCSGHLREFGRCAQENGLMVVFRCRELNRRVNECMAEHNSHEKFEAFIRENETELERRTLRSKT